MNLQNDKKIQQLYQLLPDGVIAPASWLADNGYSMQLLYQYIKSGWLQKMSRGCYIRSNTVASWQGVVLGLQKLANESFHIGGLSALNLQGYAHYLPFNTAQTLYLYGSKNVPAWFKAIALNENITVLKKPYFDQIGLKTIPSTIKDWEIVVSTPERAILELLYQVKPDGLGFEFVAEIFENLTTLRPSLLNDLLAMCDNVRVKRLFLFLATHFNHPWMKHIKTDTLNLGSGRMQIVNNGVFNNQFLITVPKGYHHA